MLRASLRFGRCARFILVSLLVLGGLPGCDQLGFGSKSKNSVRQDPGVFRDLGIYKIQVFFVVKQSDLDLLNKPAKETGTVRFIKQRIWKQERVVPSGPETQWVKQRKRWVLTRIVEKKTSDEDASSDRSFLYWKDGVAFLVNDKNLLVTAASLLQLTKNNEVVPDSKGGACSRDCEPLKPRKIAVVLADGEHLSFVNAKAVEEILHKNPLISEDMALLQPEKQLPGKPLPIANYEPVTSSEVRAVGYTGVIEYLNDINIKKQTLESLDKKGLTRSDKTFWPEYMTEWEKQLETEYKAGPARFSATYTQGVVSRHFPYEKLSIIQHQAPMDYGNTGGPLFDNCGSVVGLNIYNPASKNLSMSLGSIWLAEQIKASGRDINFAGICLLPSTQKQMTWIITGVAILLSFATLFFAFRKTSSGQRGYTVLTRVRSVPSSRGAFDPRVPQLGGSVGAPTVLASGPDRTNPGGLVGYVRLAPSSGGNPIGISTARISSGAYIGRDAGNDGVIDDASVSRKHARLNFDSAGRLVIEDAGSSNGTWKNGAKISREIFGSGDLVRFGNVEFKIDLPSNSAGNPATDLLPGSHGEQSLILSGIDGDGRAVQFSLKSSPTERSWTLGRKSGDADLVIPNLRVSSVHARIRYRPGRGFEISDLGSSNGTKIDGRYVDRDYISLDKVRKISLGDFDLNINQG